MKRIRGIISALILSTVVFSVAAQKEQNVIRERKQYVLRENEGNSLREVEENSLREVEERNAYGDNWFISLQGNANLLTAEQDGFVSALDRIKFGGALTVGKWFNENFGVRIQGSGGALRGFNDIYPRSAEGAYYVHNNYKHNEFPMAGDPRDGGSKFKFAKEKKGRPTGFWQDFNYASATFDLMANFTNLMRGHYREQNPIDVIPFVGLGYLHAFNNKVTTPNFHHFVVKLGFRVNFNLTENFALYLEPQGNATSEEFDGYAGTAVGDGFVNLGLGLQYTFNKRFTSLYQVARLSADEIDRLNRKINDNRYLIGVHQDILERQQNLLDRLEKCCDERPAQVTQIIEKHCLPDYVRFGLDSYKLEPSELRKIAEVADYLKTNDSKLLVVGYADRKTGNPRYNLSLSQKRVDVVVAELKRLGINANRLVLDWKGDKEQPFPQNEWNRVVVLVERK